MDGFDILRAARYVARQWYNKLRCNATSHDMIGFVALRLCEAARRHGGLSNKLRMHIAKQSAIDFMRHRRRLKCSRLLFGVPHDKADIHDYTPDEFDTLVAPLPADERAVMQRLFVFDESQQEAADSLGMTRARLRRLYDKAVTTLRGKLCTPPHFACCSAQTALRPAKRQSAS